MRVEGHKRLIRKMRQLTPEIRRDVAKAIDKSLQEGASTARVLVPEASGALAETISYEMHPSGLSGKITAGEKTGDGQQKALTVEGGRRPDARAGAMAAQPYMSIARKALARKHKNRVARAVRKAAKRVSNSG